MTKDIGDLNHMELAMCNNILIGEELYGTQHWQDFAYKKLAALGLPSVTDIFIRVLSDKMMPIEHRASIAALFYFHIEEIIAFNGSMPEGLSADCTKEMYEIGRLHPIEVFMCNRVITLIAKWYLTAPWYKHGMVYHGTNVITGAPIHQLRLKDLLYELRNCNIVAMQQKPLDCTSIKVTHSESESGDKQKFEVKLS